MMMMMILLPLLLLAFGPNAVPAMSIGVSSTTKAAAETASGGVRTLHRLTNETAMEVFKKSSEIMNVTGADSVLMKLETIAPRSADGTDDGNLMLLVMKKPNTTANDTLMERFNAFYINMAQREPNAAAVSPTSAISAVWGLVMDSAREYVWKRVKTLQELFQTFTPTLVRPPTGRSAAGGATDAVSFVEPRVFFLIPEPMMADSSDVPTDSLPSSAAAVTPATGDTPSPAGNGPAEAQVVIPQIKKSAQLLPGTIKDPKAIMNLIHPLRYLVRPIGAFSGMNVHTADRTFTSVGTMITHTGLHLSLIGRII